MPRLLAGVKASGRCEGFGMVGSDVSLGEGKSRPLYWLFKSPIVFICRVSLQPITGSVFLSIS